MLQRFWGCAPQAGTVRHMAGAARMKSCSYVACTQALLRLQSR